VFQAILEQLSTVDAPVPGDEGVLSFMKSMPARYQTFISLGLRSQPNLTLQSLINDLIQEKNFHEKSQFDYR
jgi:hypothetical protein